VTEGNKSVLPGGPVRPTAGATVAHRPLDGPGAEITAGLLGDWRQRNRAASLPLALRQLEVAGNLDNVRLAISGVGGPYRGPVFMDSDIYKTLEAVSWELARASAASLTEFAAETTALLAKAQQPDGYLNSYSQVSGSPRYARLESSHELYCAGHLIQAAVAAARSFDEGALLAVATRLADHLVSRFLGQNDGLDGHPIVETALVELYRQTGTAAYLDLASQFVDQRGRGLVGDSGFGVRYLQDHLPVRESGFEVGHAVRALYLESGVVDVAAETGETALLDSSIARWDDMVVTKTALTGGNGSRHSGEAFGDAYELPPDRAYNETCAAIASFQWSWRLLLATGESRYADLMERLLYNGFASAIGTDGQRFFYVNPLQRRVDHFEDDDPGRRRQWFSCACCPPNIMRLLASLGHYLATVSGDTLYLHLLTGARLGARLAGGTFGVSLTTDYPWTGTAQVTVDDCPPAECGLAVRVPGWCGELTVSLNAEPLAYATDGHGYLVIRRRWQVGDVIACTFGLTPRFSFPSRRIDALRGTAAVERGPLVYCFEQADQANGDDLEDLAIRTDPGRLTERPNSVPGVGETILIEAEAVRLPPASAPASASAYSPEPAHSSAGSPAIAVAIPYFQWDNRDGRAMRVWMPAAATATDPDPDKQ